MYTSVWNRFSYNNHPISLVMDAKITFDDTEKIVKANKTIHSILSNDVIIL